jgi:cystathionine beta-lyase/cystathionine gamma-synthase
VLRGGGQYFQEGNVLWIAYSFRGKSYRESAHTSDEKAARKRLKQRLKQVERPGFVGSKENMWTLADMRDITTPAVQEYTTKRLQSGAARAFINRELAFLRHGFKLMLKAGEISAIPTVIELLQRENVRKGFLARRSLYHCRRKYRNPDVRGLGSLFVQ